MIFFFRIAFDIRRDNVWNFVRCYMMLPLIVLKMTFLSLVSCGFQDMFVFNSISSQVTAALRIAYCLCSFSTSLPRRMLKNSSYVHCVWKGWVIPDYINMFSSDQFFFKRFTYLFESEWVECTGMQVLRSRGRGRGEGEGGSRFPSKPVFRTVGPWPEPKWRAGCLPDWAIPGVCPLTSCLFVSKFH